MKQAIFIFMILGLTLLSCKKSDTIDPRPTSLDGKWRMILVTENVSGLTSTKPHAIQGDVDITFSSTSSTNGTFTGNTPTNDIWPNDYSIGTNQSMTIPCLSMTKVMETSWGNEFVNNIRSSEEYSFQTGGRLTIKTTTKTLTFKKL
jgi:hypothetical protein